MVTNHLQVGAEPFHIVIEDIRIVFTCRNWLIFCLLFSLWLGGPSRRYTYVWSRVAIKNGSSIEYYDKRYITRFFSPRFFIAEIAIMSGTNDSYGDKGYTIISLYDRHGKVFFGQYYRIPINTDFRNVHDLAN